MCSEIHKNQMITKYFIFHYTNETFCFRLFGWGVYLFDEKAEWLSYSTKRNDRGLLKINGYFLEWMIPLWLQILKRRYRYNG